MWSIVIIFEQTSEICFRDIDGTVRMKIRHRKKKKSKKKYASEQKIQADLNKWKDVLNLKMCGKCLKAQEKGERTLIRSDFKKRHLFIVCLFEQFGYSTLLYSNIHVQR